MFDFSLLSLTHLTTFKERCRQSSWLSRHHLHLPPFTVDFFGSSEAREKIYLMKCVKQILVKNVYLSTFYDGIQSTLLLTPIYGYRERMVGC